MSFVERRRSQRIGPQMMEVIQQVLRRLQDEYGESYSGVMVGDSDSEYEPSDSEESEKETEVLLEPVTTKFIVRKHDVQCDCSICLDPISFRQHGLRLLCGH